jgi:signal transduction histidine kinase
VGSGAGSGADGSDADNGSGGVPELDPDEEHQVLRIVQEAVTNALRHAKASRVVVMLAGADEGSTLVARVVDDGVGFDPSARVLRARRLGLTSMQDRAEALGGTLAIDSEAGRGTTVELRVPT